MKMTQVERLEDDKKEFRILFDAHELITSVPSSSEIIAMELYKKTRSVADWLMYLSEAAQRIEDNLKDK